MPVLSATVEKSWKMLRPVLPKWMLSSIMCAGITICFFIMSANASMVPLGSLQRNIGNEKQQQRDRAAQVLHNTTARKDIYISALDVASCGLCMSTRAICSVRLQKQLAVIGSQANGILQAASRPRS